MRRSLLLLPLSLFVLTAAKATPIALVARFSGNTLTFRPRQVEPDAIGDCLYRVWLETVGPDGSRGPTLWELDATGTSHACVSLPIVYGHVPAGMARQRGGPVPRLRAGVAYRIAASGRAAYEGRFRIERRGARWHLVDGG